MINRDDYKGIDRERTGLTVSDPEEIIDNRPLVLHCGITAPTYSSAAMLRGWEANGWRHSFYNWQRIKFECGIEGMRERLLIKAQTEHPDLIFLHLQQPEALDADTLMQLQTIAPCINYTFDVRTTDKSKWLAEWAKHIDLTLVACREDADYINKELGSEKSFVLQSACDMDFYRPVPKKEGYPKISFQGNNYENTNVGFELAADRQRMIEFLYKEFPGQFEAYGIGQQNRQTNIHQELDLLCSSDIVINQNNFLRNSYTSDRLWRAMASGSFVLTSWFPGIETIFKKGVHLDWWYDLEELKIMIRFYLATHEVRKNIAKLGCDLVRNNHTWEHRMAEILSLLKSSKS